MAPPTSRSTTRASSLVSFTTLCLLLLVHLQASSASTVDNIEEQTLIIDQLTDDGQAAYRQLEEASLQGVGGDIDSPRSQYSHYNNNNNNNTGRFKRQVPFFSCPSEPARTRSSRMRVLVSIYSPKLRQDVEIVQPRKSDWSEQDVDRLVAGGHFDLNKPTLIYTHGYLQDIQSAWLLAARRRFDELYPPQGGPAAYNLMFYDWSAYGQRAYSTAASYVPYLGKQLAQLLGKLSRRYQYELGKVHIVAYSLSTHIAGQTGRKLTAANPAVKLGQITALDPTGVCFHAKSSPFGDKYSLRASDAQLVVARHYDMGRLGARRPIGGLDIYVNGGSDQPAMLPRSLSGRQLVASTGGLSSHSRASEHEIEPFELGRASCHEVAYACRSYRAYLAGECGDCASGRNNNSSSSNNNNSNNNNRCYLVNTLAHYDDQLAGQDQRASYQPNTGMYITTGRLDFCQFTYQVVVRLAVAANSSGSGASSNLRKAIEAGALSINLNNGQRVAPTHKLGAHHYTALVVGSEPLELTEQLEVGGNGADYPRKMARQLASAIKSVDIKYMSNIWPSERARFSARYCAQVQRGLSLVRC